MSTTGVSIGSLVRQLRLRAGFSQEELAERAGLTASGISQIERGTRRRPQPHTLRALAGALRLSPEERRALLSAVEAEGTSSAPAGPPASTASTPAPESPVIEEGRPPGNLPLVLTSFIGRERELAAAASFIAEGQRLLTLTGPGGAGKTRLAVELARAVSPRFMDGTRFVDLASLSNPALVVNVIAAATGVTDAPGRPLLESIVSGLQQRRLLLLLDNCEHVISAAAAVVREMLSSCPKLVIVATSREPLMVQGEQIYPLPSLACPPVDPLVATLQPEALHESPAIRLFVERARAVFPGFVLSRANAAAVVEICRRLDGLPLAIELAAARVRVLPPPLLAVRLHDRFRLVAGSERGREPRHQTLRALLDWSHDLLTTGEQALLRRLAVFASGFDVEAVEALCSVPGGAAPPPAPFVSIPSIGVFDLLAALVDKSLVTADQHSGRYSLLESVRAYAADKLAAAGETPWFQDRHRDWYLSLAEQAAPHLRGAEQVTWLARLTDDADNLRTALQWSIDQGDTNRGVRLAVALTRFWESRSAWSEGRQVLRSLLTARTAATLPPDLHARALLAAGQLAHWQDLDEAVTLLRAAEDLANATSEQAIRADALLWLGSTKRRQGDFAAALALLEEGLALSRASDHPEGIALALLTLGVTLWNQGDTAGAIRHLEQALAGYLEVGDLRWIATTRTMLGSCLAARGDAERAWPLLRAGLAGLHEVGDRAFVLTGMWALATLAARTGRPVHAARLLGATEAVRLDLGATLAPVNQATQAGVIAAIRPALDDVQFAATVAEGQALSPSAALAFALDILDPSEPRTAN